MRRRVQGSRDMTEPLTRQHRLLLLLVGSALLINHYDLGVFSLALPQIQHGLGIAEEEVGLYSGIVRLGVLLAFPLAYMADVVGRRRLLLFTLAGMTLATVGTAFVQAPWQFLALQSLARCFAYAEEMLCFVVIAEEFSAGRRGWAFARLAALGAFGYGLAALLYSAVDILPGGWRAFYVLGGAGLALLVLARRGLPETARFAQQRETLAARAAPFVSLVRAYPGRFLALVATTLPFTLGLTPALTLVSKFLQEERGFTPGGVSLLYFIGGGVSIAGYFLAGRLSDRFGRKRVLFVTMLVSPLVLACVFLGPSGLWIAPAWSLGLFFYFAADVTLAGIGSELFPTSYRATATAARTVFGTFAALGGLALESALYGPLGGHGPAIVALAFIAPFGVLPMLLFLPETAARPLEEIAPEPALN